MTAVILPLAASHFVTGLLSLVIPLGVLVLVTVWYVLRLRHEEP